MAEVTVERDSMLMLKSTYHPNWHAYVDGVETEAVMLKPSYLGVKLLLGDRIVRLHNRFRPLRGIPLVAGVIMLALIALVERHQERIGLWLTTSFSARISGFKKG